MPKSKPSIAIDMFTEFGSNNGRGAVAKPKPKPLKPRALLNAPQTSPSPEASLDYQSSSSTADSWSSPIRWLSPSPPALVRLDPFNWSPGLKSMADQSRSSSPAPILSSLTNTSPAPCTVCKKPNDTLRYKRCSTCREKEKKYREKKKLKKQLEDAEMNLEEYGLEMGEIEKMVVQATVENTKESLNKLAGRGVTNGNDRKKKKPAKKKKRKSSQHSWLLGSASEDDDDDLPAKKKQKLDANKTSEIAKMMERLKEKENIRLRAAARNGRKDESLKEITAEKYPTLNTYTDKHGHVWKAFQNSQEMYEFLQRLTSKSSTQTKKAQKKELMNFRGCYSIVTSSSMDEKQRANLVVDELQRLGKVPFYDEIPTHDCGSKMTFRCTCRASTSSDSSPDRTSTLRTETVLIEEDPLEPGWSRMSKPKVKWRKTSTGMRTTGYHIPRNGRLIEIQVPIEASSSQTPLPRGRAKNEICGGRVVVSVEEDTSHPIFHGQRIFVEVWHD